MFSIVRLEVEWVRIAAFLGVLQVAAHKPAAINVCNRQIRAERPPKHALPALSPSQLRNWPRATEIVQLFISSDHMFKSTSPSAPAAPQGNPATPASNSPIHRVDVAEFKTPAQQKIESHTIEIKLALEHYDKVINKLNDAKNNEKSQRTQFNLKYQELEKIESQLKTETYKIIGPITQKILTSSEHTPLSHFEDLELNILAKLINNDPNLIEIRSEIKIKKQIIDERKKDIKNIEIDISNILNIENSIKANLSELKNELAEILNALDSKKINDFNNIDAEHLLNIVDQKVASSDYSMAKDALKNAEQALVKFQETLDYNSAKNDSIASVLLFTREKLNKGLDPFLESKEEQGIDIILGSNGYTAEFLSNTENIKNYEALMKSIDYFVDFINQKKHLQSLKIKASENFSAAKDRLFKAQAKLDQSEILFKESNIEAENIASALDKHIIGAPLEKSSDDDYPTEETPSSITGHSDTIDENQFKEQVNIIGESNAQDPL